MVSLLPDGSRSGLSNSDEYVSYNKEQAALERSLLRSPSINEEGMERLRIAVARSYTHNRWQSASDDSEMEADRPDQMHAGKEEEEASFLEERAEAEGGGWRASGGDDSLLLSASAITIAYLLLSLDYNLANAWLYPYLSIEEKRGWAPDCRAPDVLHECKVELDRIAGLQGSDGSVSAKAHEKLHAGQAAAAEHIQQQEAWESFGIGTALFTGAMAMASRAYQPYDSEYAAVLLKRAQLAQLWLDKHLNEGLLPNNRGGVYPPNSSKRSDRDERFWALAELFRTTSDAAYSEKLIRFFPDLIAKPAGILRHSNVSLLGQWAIASSARMPAWLHNLARNCIVRSAAEEAGKYRRIRSRREKKNRRAAYPAALGALLLMAEHLDSDCDYQAETLELLNLSLAEERIHHGADPDLAPTNSGREISKGPNLEKLAPVYFLLYARTFMQRRSGQEVSGESDSSKRLLVPQDNEP